MIVHAGFHKTGTTTAQDFLRANGKHIYPRCALVLPGRLRKGAARMAVRYARFGTDALLDQFGEDLRNVLSALEVKNRAVLISDENLSGRMPGRDGQPDYGSTPALMARAEQVIRDVFGADSDVVFQFTTRAPDAWLRSSYKHNLRTSRLVMDEADYKATYGGAADLGKVARNVEQAITGAVHVADLKDLTGELGPAQPLIDLIGLPDHLGRRLTPHPAQNAGPDDELVDDLLALNRSALSDEALKAAKMDLLGKAQEDDG
ncbi:hypothetical protein Q4555_07105 [Octadecabacter sp. 1_MG-2023]|uniref:hypothetical protein n=1 Tax=unclassified Octadecabacter TaxID=196158 RepID=UPI001C094D98|nr:MULTISPECIES: hypothetical protein [unclassified Octadecabacter]MBU2994280.1 hypothetical protein [Octadecabacter sp. B2R22]MDO6734431.1 hypothetical protein [Octadecabacter sp. 1_MG-2023]